MGKPYASELKALTTTYGWATTAPVASLARALASASSTPILIIGSGGSLTAAHFAAALHQKHTGKLAKAVTPLEAASHLADLRDTAVMVLSAGGKNPDVLGILKKAVGYEPARIIVVCSQEKSPLSRLAEEYRSVDVETFNLPSGKDGFLATNSLLAFAILLARAYAGGYSTGFTLPPTLDGLTHPDQSHGEFINVLGKACLPLWSRDNLIVLYGAASQAAAFDVESKFTEAALGAVQPADYRNFAHGRHHWLAKRGGTTGVLAFTAEDDAEIARRTLRLLPAEVPVARIDLKGDKITAGIAALVATLNIVGLAGEAKGIDPGRPGVPDFGRKIYNLRTSSTANGFKGAGHQGSESFFIKRKSGGYFAAGPESAEPSFWLEAYREFTSRLCSTSFGAVVCDYDGTLCDGSGRFGALDREIGEHLARLLAAGLLIGVATGRGKSIKEVLRASLPERSWPRVIVGYYNGGDIGGLEDDGKPDGTPEVCEALIPAAEALRANYVISKFCECSFRRMQITVESKDPAAADTVWNTVQQLVHSSRATGTSVLRSSHSIDIIAPGVSKRKLTEHIYQRVGASGGKSAVLCIGDRGQFPGNDFDLLQEPYSLSVDETSTDPATCWNLAPRGYRGVQAAAYYLRSLRRASGGGVRFVIPD